MLVTLLLIRAGLHLYQRPARPLPVPIGRTYSLGGLLA